MFKTDGKGGKRRWGDKCEQRSEVEKRSAALGFYSHSAQPSLTACGSGSYTAEGVDVDWVEEAHEFIAHTLRSALLFSCSM